MSQATLLDGIVVLDATQVMAGPYCAMLLADMGARVIKVEPPAGDSTRSMAGARGNDSPAFNAVNRGKQGIVLDLNHEKGRAVFKRLARLSDILVENYRPGVMAKFGLDYESLRAENPRLIYASISGHGQSGPWASKGGFDLIAQGLSGVMSVTGTADGEPVKAGVPLTDLGAGLFALIGILAALHHRSKSGQGQHVDTSLVDAGLALSVWEVTDYFASGNVPRPLGSAHRMTAPYQAFKCADGYITIGAANDRNFAKLARVLGRHEWITDPRFVADHQRVAHRDELAGLIEEVTSKEPRGVLDRRARESRHPVRTDPRLRRRLDDAAGDRAGDDGRRRAPDARHAADARHADQDVGDAAQPKTARPDARRTHRRRPGGSGIQPGRNRTAAIRRRNRLTFYERSTMRSTIVLRSTRSVR